MSGYNREKLYEEVWKEPVSVVAKRYGISDTALAKACRRLTVPLPPRGYWAKVRAGVSASIPALPENLPDRDEAKSTEEKHKSQNAEKDTQSTKKENYHSEYEDRKLKRIHVFMKGHMLEKEDIIHHFRYLITCLKKENYAGYSDEYKRRRTKFLEDCISIIKSAHLPTILAPWTFYECQESTSGFSISIGEITKMNVKDDDIVSEETKQLCDVLLLSYQDVSISEYASIHQITEATVFEWLNTGKLCGAFFEDGEWSIPELHRIPEEDEYTIFLEFDPDEPVDIPTYPLLSSCTELWIEPEDGRFLIKYFGEERELIGQLNISPKEKGALMGALLKQGVTWDTFAYEIPYYSAKKHFEIDFSKWHDIPSCDW